MATQGRTIWKKGDGNPMPTLTPAQKASKIRPLVFERSHESDTTSLGRETITQLCTMASGHGSAMAQGTIILPPFGYDNLLRMINRISEREMCMTDYDRNAMLAHFLADGGALRLYIGENKIFSPNAYYAALSLVRKDIRSKVGFPELVEDMLSRVQDMLEFLGRKFIQKKHAEENGGSRTIDINDDEYVALYLREFRGIREKKCMICGDDGQNSKHHILPKGAFRELHERNRERIMSLLEARTESEHKARQLLREAGDFGRNIMPLCKKCHRALEYDINRTTLVHTPGDEYGHLVAADLYIIPTKKIAQYGLIEVSYDNPEIIRMARKIEDNLALECFNFYKNIENGVAQ